MRCHPLSKMGGKPRKTLTSGGTSDTSPSAEQNGMKTIVKAVDKWKNEQSTVIGRAKWRVNRESH